MQSTSLSTTIEQALDALRRTPNESSFPNENSLIVSRKRKRPQSPDFPSNPTVQPWSGTTATIPFATTSAASPLKSEAQPGTSASTHAPDAGTERTYPGYCMMCEIHSPWIKNHRRVYHKKKHPFVFDKKTFNLRILRYEGTDKTELEMCTNCKRPFFRYRCANHECIIDHGIHPKIECIGPQSTAKGAGYCLMCKDYFNDLNAHRDEYHLGNARYENREVKGQSVLLPKETDDEKDLGKCPKCLRVMYISEYFKHIHTE